METDKCVSGALRNPFQETAGEHYKLDPEAPFAENTILDNHKRSKEGKNWVEVPGRGHKGALTKGRSKLVRPPTRNVSGVLVS